jgi:hypothetical protein
MPFTSRELSRDTLSDFEALAAKQGSCWCMHYQRPKPVPRGGTTNDHRAINRRDKAKLVREGRSHAILVYDGQMPVGWCQYGPREELPGLMRDAATAKWALPPKMRGSGGSRVSSSTERTAAEASPRSPFRPRSNPSGDRAAESSRPSQSSRRKWRPSPNGGGSGPQACSGRRGSGPSRRSGRVGS